jgi:protein phosphatase
VNQDAFSCANILYSNSKRLSFPSRKVIEIPSGEPLVFAVADGMGGHEAGEDASKFALEGICEKLKYLNLDTDNVNELIYKSIVELHEELLQHGMDRNHKDMGTTLTGVLIYDKKMIYFHVGDTRLYAYSDGKIQLLTIDHSLAWEKKSLTYKHFLTSCVGGGVKNIRIDIQDISFLLQSGNFLLLTTDGLHETLEESFFGEVITDNKDVIKISKILLQESLFRESNDNLTIVTIKFL